MKELEKEKLRGGLRIQPENVPSGCFTRKTLLDTIRRNGRASRTQLAELTGLTFMAVKRNMEELLDLGLIREDGTEPSSVGRKSVLYAVNESFACTAGIYINMYETRAAVMDLGGTILYSKRMAMDQPCNQAELIDRVIRLAQETLEESGQPRERILGVGIGVPGPVDPGRGLVLSPPNLTCLQYVPLRGIVEQALGLPAFLQKDANVIALGELRHGAARGHADMMYIYADVGIGGGLVLNGSLYLGLNAGAGEIGHITLDQDGPVCNCASTGCVEAIASGLAVTRRYNREKGCSASIEDVLQAAVQNDTCAVMCLNDSARTLGIAVGSLINLLDLPVIVIGGLLAERYEPYLALVRQSATEKKLKGYRSNRILPSALANNAGVIGAGELVADHFFKTGVLELFQSGAAS